MDEKEMLDLEQRAVRGDAEAMVELATSLLQPPIRDSGDLSRAHRLLTDAGDLGHVRALRLRASLIATGTGSTPDPLAALALIRRCASLGDHFAKLELIMLSRMVCHTVPAPETLSAKPLVQHYRSFLTQSECGYLKTLAEPRFEPSMVMDPVSGQRFPDPVRTSDGMSFGPHNEDIVVNASNHRIAAATGTRYDHGEPLHLLRYRGGQQYRPHGDALPGSGNLRLLTAITYLNDDSDYGETEFPLLELKVKAAAGDLLVFCNVNEEGDPEPLSRHAGLPVTRGTKYIATRWIRAKRYHPWA
jgi:prolyl 4-hydroxylase